MSAVIKGERCFLTVLRCIVPILALGRHVQIVLYHREMDHAIEKSTNGGPRANLANNYPYFGFIILFSLHLIATKVHYSNRPVALYR